MSFQIDLNSLDFFDLIRIGSFLLNFVVLVGWVKDRIVLRRFLVGKWEGHFKHELEDRIYECQLIVAKQNDRDNAAYFYYKGKKLENGELILIGLDKLQDYDDDILFVMNRKWKAKFVREFNKEVGNSSTCENIPPCYDWTCDVKSLFFRPKMQVTIDAEGRIFTGQLTRA